MAHRLAATLAFVLLSGHPGHTAPMIIQLSPERAHVELTVFAVGMFPLAGTFDRFFGQLSLDAAMPGQCSVTLTVNVASLKMPRSIQTSAALGSTLLDAGRYPQLHFAGTCTGGLASGVLTMHGVTRPIVLATGQDENTLTASGAVMRADYGVSGLPGLVGGRVNIRFEVKIPAGWARSAQHQAGGQPVALAVQPGSNIKAAPFMQ